MSGLGRSNAAGLLALTRVFFYAAAAMTHSLLSSFRGALALVIALVASPALATSPVPFIDAHVHLNDVSMQLSLMQRYGAQKAVVFWGGRSSNESVAQAAREHPDRFIAFASVSPERRAYQSAWRGGDASALLAELDALLASGQYRGIGEINAVHFESAGFAETDYALDGPLMDGIMTLARKHRVPVMLHVESTRMAELSALLDRHADVPVIWAHGGYTPLILARRMLARHPQLYYELSARTWPRHPRSPEFTLLRDGQQLWPEWLKLIEAMPERFVVGTDASHRDLASEEMKYASVQNFLVQLSPRAQALVGRSNLLRLLGLDSALR